MNVYTDPEEIQLRKQSARNAFMESLERNGQEPRDYTAMADKWWSDTEPSKGERT